MHISCARSQAQIRRTPPYSQADLGAQARAQGQSPRSKQHASTCAGPAEAQMHQTMSLANRGKARRESQVQAACKQVCANLTAVKVEETPSPTNRV
eukprot:1153486-Pelagomonas_calceolata.AAC.2